MYLYPENLKSRARLWFWSLKDLCTMGVLLLVGMLLFSTSGSTFLLVGGLVYGFLTIQMDEITIRDFICYATRYFLLEQQHFEWRMHSEKDERVIDS